MYGRRSAIGAIGLLLLTLCAIACTSPEPSPTPTLWLKSGDSIDTVAVAPDGSVWVSIREHGHVDIATTISRGTGVAHYDGQTWTTYTTADGLPSADIGPIAVSADGAAWFGTSTGVIHFDGRTWTTYTKEDGLAEGSISSIAVAPDGALWFGAVGSIRLDREGTVRIEDRGGVSRFTGLTTGTGDGETWTTYTTADGLPGDLDEDVAAIEDIAVAPDGAVWVGNASGGVSRFTGPATSTGDGKSWTTYTTDDGLVDDDVSSLAVAPDGKVWIATSWGVSCYDPGAARLGAGGEAWTSYGPEHGLAERGIRFIDVAPDGTVWVSYWGWTEGISRFAGPTTSTGDGQTWTTYDEDDGLPSNSVTSIAVAPDSALWVSTEAGTVSRLTDPATSTGDGQTWTTFTVEEMAHR
jgi:ligand-binding sensor domain-containing protein